MSRRRWAKLAGWALLGSLGAAQAGTVGGFHATPDRAGLTRVPGLTVAAASRTRPDTGFQARLPGLVNAQPLYWRPPGAARGWVIAASEANAVAAFDAASGRAVWRRVLGPPARRAAACGGIDPVGVTGTPVIDAARGALYLDSVIATPGGERHEIFGLALRDGAVLPGYPLMVRAGLARLGVRFADGVQENRAALGLFRGRLLVAFGGYDGDCGPYHGVLAAIDPARPALVAAWATKAIRGGIWNAAGIVSDGAHFFVSTGNTEGAAVWGGGEAVLRFGADLRRPDFFAPANWQALDAADLDLGGMNPTLLDLPGAAAPHQILALGKDGFAYLLDRDHLAGIGGALLRQRVSTAPLRGSTARFAVSGPAGVVQLVVMPDPGLGCAGPGGMTALGVSLVGGRPALQQAWCGSLPGGGSPVVTESAPGRDPVVWAVGAEGDGRLHGFDGLTGAPVYTSAALPALVPHFSTLLVAAGRIYVPADGRIFAFRLGAGR